MHAGRVHEDSARNVDKRLGQEVGLNYRVIRHLATGGEANVYLAEHLRHGGLAAAKFIEPGAGISTGVLQYEARLLARARHPNIARFIDYGRSGDGSDCLLMEYARGIDLAEWIAYVGPRAARKRSLGILLQVAAAIDHLHACGIVHGDVKPANVMIDPNGLDAVKLIDFGLAFEQQRAALRPAGTGTPRYMAPEVVRGDPCGPGIDHFAFAALSYELLTGRAFEPHVSEAPRRGATTAAELMVRAQVQAPAGWLAGEPVYARALHEDPAARFASAHEFVTALS